MNFIPHPTYSPDLAPRDFSLFPRLKIKLKQNYWVFGLFPFSGILENTTFWKLDLFMSSDEGGGEDAYSVGPRRKNESQSLDNLCCLL
jgi:hypothetical protein